jgi:hypothetical protein
VDSKLLHTSLAGFAIRETAEWKKHAADLEMEMIKRGMIFEVINWSQSQAGLPL